MDKLNEIVSCESEGCDQCYIQPARAIKVPGSFFVSVSHAEWLNYLVPKLHDKMNFDIEPNLEDIHNVTGGTECQRLKAIHQSTKTATGYHSSQMITITLGYDGASYTKDKKIDLANRSIH